jgi:hypothetical protein
MFTSLRAKIPGQARDFELNLEPVCIDPYQHVGCPLCKLPEQLIQGKMPLKQLREFTIRQHIFANYSSCDPRMAVFNTDLYHPQPNPHEEPSIQQWQDAFCTWARSLEEADAKCGCDSRSKLLEHARLRQISYAHSSQCCDLCCRELPERYEPRSDPGGRIWLIDCVIHRIMEKNSRGTTCRIDLYMGRFKYVLESPSSMSLPE